MEYDVFISYRRDGGEHLAKMIRDSLTERGYHVFFDVESLRSGEFNTALYDVIEHCKDIVLICSPRALDRCANDDDWVRQEIECAIKHKKNIIPIMARGFVFPEVLPESIDNIRWMNGLEANMEFYDAFLDKLEAFLKSEPIERKKRKRKVLIITSILVLVSVIVTIITGVLWGKRDKEPLVYPNSDEEKAAVSELIYYVEWNLSQVDSGINYAKKVIDLYQNYLNDDDHSEEAMLEMLQNAVAYINKIRDCTEAVKPAEEGLTNALQGSPIEASEVTAIPDATKVLLENMDLELSNFGIAIMYYPERIEDEKAWVEIYSQMVELDAKNYFYSMNETLSAVNSESIESFRTEYLPMLYMASEYTWVNSKEEANRLCDEAYKEYLELVDELEIYVFDTK